MIKFSIGGKAVDPRKVKDTMIAAMLEGIRKHYGMSAKWLELLKDIAPRINRVAVLRDSFTPVGIGQLAAIQGVAPLQ